MTNSQAPLYITPHSFQKFHKKVRFYEFITQEQTSLNWLIIFHKMPWGFLLTRGQKEFHPISIKTLLPTCRRSFSFHWILSGVWIVLSCLLATWVVEEEEEEEEGDIISVMNVTRVPHINNLIVVTTALTGDPVL